MPPDGTDQPLPDDSDGTLLARGSRLGRLTLFTVTLGSGIAMLDGTVVNIALRHIGSDLGASLAELQWVSNGYLADAWPPSSWSAGRWATGWGVDGSTWSASPASR